MTVLSRYSLIASAEESFSLLAVFGRALMEISKCISSEHQSWNKSKANTNGKILSSDLSSGHYSVLYSNGPTCFSSIRNSSSIDLVLTNQNEYCGSVETYVDFNSDHLPVTFSLSHETIQT